MVEVCRDGAAALKKIEGEEHFDLLILDGRLGGASSVELIGRARQTTRLRATPIVMFSAQQCDAPTGSLTADAYLSKPGGLKNLVATCRRLLPQAVGQARPDAPSAGPGEPAD